MAAHDPRLWETLRPKSGYLDLTVNALRVLGSRLTEQDHTVRSAHAQTLWRCGVE